MPHSIIPVIWISGKRTAIDVEKTSVVPWVGGKDMERKKSTKNFKGSETILYYFNGRSITLWAS